MYTFWYGNTTAAAPAEAPTKNKRADRVKVGDVSRTGNVVSKVRDDAGYIVITFENGNSIMTYADDPVSIRTTVEAHRRNVARRKAGTSSTAPPWAARTSTQGSAHHAARSGTEPEMSTEITDRTAEAQTDADEEAVEPSVRERLLDMIMAGVPAEAEIDRLVETEIESDKADRTQLLYGTRRVLGWGIPERWEIYNRRTGEAVTTR